MVNRKIFVAPIVMSAMVLLSGCSGHSGIEALDRPSVSEDALPAEATAALKDTVNVKTSRLLTTHDQVRYFAALSGDGTEGCIIVLPSGADPQEFAGCGLLGSTDEIVTASIMPGNKAATLVRDDADTRKQESEGWTRIHQNVLIPNS